LELLKKFIKKERAKRGVSSPLYKSCVGHEKWGAERVDLGGFGRWVTPSEKKSAQEESGRKGVFSKKKTERQGSGRTREKRLRKSRLRGGEETVW